MITSREPAAASCRPAGTRHDFLLSDTCSLLLHLLLLVCLLLLLLLILLPILLLLLLLLQLLQQPRKSRPARLSPAGHYRAEGHVYRVMWPSVMCSPRSAELSALLSHSPHRNCRLTQYSCTVPRSAVSRAPAPVLGPRAAESRASVAGSRVAVAGSRAADAGSRAAVAGSRAAVSGSRAAVTKPCQCLV